MPYTWTAERERRMLLLAISSANLRPSAETWAHVANLLGEGLSASAVRCVTMSRGTNITSNEYFHSNSQGRADFVAVRNTTSSKMSPLGSWKGSQSRHQQHPLNARRAVRRSRRRSILLRQSGPARPNASLSMGSRCPISVTTLAKKPNQRRWRQRASHISQAPWDR